MNPLPDETRPPVSPLEEDAAALEILAATFDPEFSRNKHFDWYHLHGAHIKSFRRIVRALLADLDRCSGRPSIRVEPEGDLYWLTLEIPRFKSERRCHVDPVELQALKLHPVLGPLLTEKNAGEGDTRLP